MGTVSDISGSSEGQGRSLGRDVKGLFIAEAWQWWDKLDSQAQADAKVWLDATLLYLTDAQDIHDEQRRLDYARSYLGRWHQHAVRLDHERNA